MTIYVQITDGAITKTVSQLPRSTERVSNFYLLPEEDRNAHGWFTVTETTDPLFDSVTEKLSQQVTNIVEGIPVASRSVEQKTVADLKAELLSRAKSAAENFIQEEYPTQEQLAALANLTTAEHRTAVSNRIQNAYGAFMTFRTQLNAATTPAEIKTLWESRPALHGGN